MSYWKQFLRLTDKPHLCGVTPTCHYINGEMLEKGLMKKYDLGRENYKQIQIRSFKDMVYYASVLDDEIDDSKINCYEIAKCWRRLGIGVWYVMRFHGNGKSRYMVDYLYFSGESDFEVWIDQFENVKRGAYWLGKFGMLVREVFFKHDTLSDPRVKEHKDKIRH